MPLRSGLAVSGLRPVARNSCCTRSSFGLGSIGRMRVEYQIQLEPSTPNRPLPVAQISNLPYRRFLIGRALKDLDKPELSDAPQVGNLRYSRLEICATLKSNERSLTRNKHGLYARRG